jgi:hypothetical protein
VKRITAASNQVPSYVILLLKCYEWRFSRRCTYQPMLVQSDFENNLSFNIYPLLRCRTVNRQEDMNRQCQVSALLCLILLLAHTGPAGVQLVAGQAATPNPPSASTNSYPDRECPMLQDLDFYNPSELRALNYGLQYDGYYFCAPTAPAQFRCKCSSSTTCFDKYDPWGRNLGECGCCPAWVWGVLSTLVIALLVGTVFCLYACCCRGRWWCDGHPLTIQPVLPRRAAPVVIAANTPIPNSLFRHFRGEHFESGLPPPPPPAAVSIGGASATGSSAVAARNRGRGEAADEEERESLVEPMGGAGVSSVSPSRVEVRFRSSRPGSAGAANAAPDRPPTREFASARPGRQGSDSSGTPTDPHPAGAVEMSAVEAFSQN